MSSRPSLSILVVVHDMPREAPRTLWSLSRRYQRQVEELDYEVMVLENPSARMLEPEAVCALGEEFSYHRLPEASPSPAGALNLGARRARAEALCLMVDGARLVSPGLVFQLTLGLTLARALRKEPLVATLSWYLGPVRHAEAPERGWDRLAEDRLLEQIGWPADGYRLFGASVLADSSRGGLFGGELAESNALALPRRLFVELGGMDERFTLPGGGLVNLDFFRRAVEHPRTQLVLLAGEGTFHQLHGGAATGGLSPPRYGWTDFHQEYQRLRGQDFAIDTSGAMVLGRVPPGTGCGWCGG